MTILLAASPGVNAQLSVAAPKARQNPTSGDAFANPGPSQDLQQGIVLNRQGRFGEALSCLKRAQDGSYVAAFNFGLAYLGVGDDAAAIRVMEELRKANDTAEVNNLLAQAYLGNGDGDRGFQAFLRAVHRTPNDEKLYAYIADACTDHALYALGLRVADTGLIHLPASPRLHYERAVFLARIDRLEEARPEFARTIELSPESDIAYLARVQQALYDDKLEEAVAAARLGIARGHRSAWMLELLGETLLHNGATPGQPAFDEAREALQGAVVANPLFSTAQLNFGKLCLMDGHPQAAVDHLKTAARLEPLNPAIYTNLAAAYGRLGDKPHADESIATLGRLLAKP